MSRSSCFRRLWCVSLFFFLLHCLAAPPASAAELDPQTIHFVLAGDSTVTDTAGWGLAFSKLLAPGVRCTNVAGGGQSTKSFRDSGRWQRVLDVRPTHVLIQFGHNDQPGKGPHRETDAATTYRENLARFVDEARAAGALPILVTSLTRRGFENGKLVDILGPYAAAMRIVAAEKQVPLVDLYARSTAIVECLGEQGSMKFSPPSKKGVDRTHLNALGAAVMAKVVGGEVRRVVPESAPCFGEQPRTVRLLTIGNSFSRNAMNYFDELALCGGQTLVLQQATIGGSSMQQHLDKARLHEQNATDPKGLYDSKRSLKDYLTAEPWDFITIQQRSLASHDVAAYRPSAEHLATYVKRYAPQAKLLLHQTWAYRVDDPRFQIATPKPGEPRTQREMYEGLTKAYDAIAAELGAGIVPVGDAFFAADRDATWGYRSAEAVDPRSFAYPKLPPQTHSLHVGWRWTTNGKQTLGMDGHHANTAGEYLAACVFYEALFGESVLDNPYVPPQLDADYADFLQATAHDAVELRRK